MDRAADPQRAAGPCRAAGPQRAAGSAATRRPPPSARAERRRMNCATDYARTCPLASLTMKHSSCSSSVHGGGKRRSVISAGIRCPPSSTLLPVDDAEHKLQVLSDARSPASLQLLGPASAAQRAAGVSRLVLSVIDRHAARRQREPRQQSIQNRRDRLVSNDCVEQIADECGVDFPAPRPRRMCSTGCTPQGTGPTPQPWAGQPVERGQHVISHHKPHTSKIPAKYYIVGPFSSLDVSLG